MLITNFLSSKSHSELLNLKRLKNYNDIQNKI